MLRGFARGWWVGEVEEGTDGGARLGAPTPHLASSLKGGRDELGKGVGLGWVVPACAGMTVGGVGMTAWGCGNDGVGGVVVM